MIDKCNLNWINSYLFVRSFVCLFFAAFVVVNSKHLHILIIVHRIDSRVKSKSAAIAVCKAQIFIDQRQILSTYRHQRVGYVLFSPVVVFIVRDVVHFGGIIYGCFENKQKSTLTLFNYIKYLERLFYHRYNLNKQL